MCTLDADGERPYRGSQVSNVTSARAHPYAPERYASARPSVCSRSAARASPRIPVRPLRRPFMVSPATARARHTFAAAVGGLAPGPRASCRRLARPCARQRSPVCRHATAAPSRSDGHDQNHTHTPSPSTLAPPPACWRRCRAICRGRQIHRGTPPPLAAAAAQGRCRRPAPQPPLGSAAAALNGLERVLTWQRRRRRRGLPRESIRPVF